MMSDQPNSFTFSLVKFSDSESEESSSEMQSLLGNEQVNPPCGGDSNHVLQLENTKVCKNMHNYSTTKNLSSFC